MPRVRVSLPVEIEVTDEELRAGKAVLDVVTKVRASGLSEALASAVDATRKAVRARRRGK
jgi:hypothetical protein